MSKVIKLKEKQLNNIIKGVMVYEGKKQSKKEKDTKYDTWCKENGWEHGVGEGCADDALDSKESSIRSWGLGFLMGSKGKSLNEQSSSHTTEDMMDNLGERILGLLGEFEDRLEAEHLVSILQVIANDLRREYEYEDEGDETFTKEDERAYDDRVNYGTDDESMYDDRNYQYGNHPDDDYWED